MGPEYRDNMEHGVALAVVFLMALSQCAKPQDCRRQLGQFDRTLEAGAKGTSVVEAVVNKIEESEIFSDDFGFLRRMASFESNNGATANSGEGGIWRVSMAVLQEIKSYPEFPELEAEIEEKFCLRWSETVGSRHRLDVPLYSALAVMMVVRLRGHEVPEDVVYRTGETLDEYF